MQWILVVSAIVVMDAAALGLSNATGNAVSNGQNPLPVSGVFSGALLGEEVGVKGTVTKVLPEYTSKKGFAYQQFLISDGEEELKVFCSEEYGKSEAKEGDEIVFEGKFQKYYEQYEIYGFCSEIKKI
jgi:predicted extracellular nuclease